MCYLVTSGDSAETEREYQTLADARKYAESLALRGVREVRVWLLTHSVTVQPQAVWKEHAKGLSGNHKE